MLLKRNLSLFALISIIFLGLCQQPAHAQFSGGLTVNTNPVGAIVTLNGDVGVSGVTPTTFRQTLIGLYKISIERYGYEKYNTQVILDPSKMMELNISLTKKTRFKSAIRSIVIPGWGQRYSNQKFRGLVYTFFAAATTFGYFKADDDFDRKYSTLRDFESQYDELEKSGTHSQLEELLPQLLHAQDRAYDAENVRRIAIGSVIAVWSLSVLDALFFFPEEKGTFKVKNLTLSPETSPRKVGVNLSYHF